MKNVITFLLTLILSLSLLTGCSGRSTEDRFTQDQQKAARNTRKRGVIPVDHPSFFVVRYIII